LPAGIDGVLRRALSKDPADRPATSRDFVAELRDACHAATTTLVPPPATPTPPTAVRRPPTTPPPARPTRYERGRRRPAYLLGALALLAAGIVTAVLVAAVRDDPGGRPNAAPTTATQPPPAPEPPPPAPEPPPPAPEPPPPPPPPSSGADLNDDGFALMQSGNYSDALPLFEQAVSSLAGSGSLAEAYASYNLANTRFALGSCEGVLPLLDRSEAIQGRRKEIDRLRREAEKSCTDGRGRGHGNGPGNGKGDKDD
jgi:hypothetical protein